MLTTAQGPVPALDQPARDPRAEASEHGMATTQGLMPYQAIRRLVQTGQVVADTQILDDQFQPASLDLRLGDVAYRLRASFLPGRGMTVERRLAQSLVHEIDLREGAPLERGLVYLVPLQERLRLAPDLSGATNPKSSIGRLDVFSRVITDSGVEFDRIPEGYSGSLYAEISPRTFSIIVRKGSKLNQVRFRVGQAETADADLVALHREQRLVDQKAAIIHNGLRLSVDLRGETTHGVVGYRAQKHTDAIDVDSVGRYDSMDFWEPIYSRRGGELILDPGQFYILSSREAVHIPPTHAAEMVPFDPLVGDFRVHYAGFFDPGFGSPAAGGALSRAVLEVRPFEIPFTLEHGQTIGRLVFEKLAEATERLYGGHIGSNYQAQGLRLSKHFRPV